MNSTAKSAPDKSPSIEAFANGGKVWLAACADCEILARFDSPFEVDEFIAGLEMAKLQAWPELKANATN
jgi:hypothetical protein